MSPKVIVLPSWVHSLLDELRAANPKMTDPQIIASALYLYKEAQRQSRTSKLFKKLGRFALTGSFKNGEVQIDATP